MTTLLAALFVFGVLVTVHEFGHFITAKMTGMRVDEFAIGFGPNIFQKKYGETLYSLRIIPLGGYNKIAGMEPCYTGWRFDEFYFAGVFVYRYFCSQRAGSTCR